MMDATDVFSGVTAFLLLALLGCLLLLVTRNHRSGLHGQCILFLCAFAIRFLLSFSIYGTELHTVVVGDGDDSGWQGGHGHHRGLGVPGAGTARLTSHLAGRFQGQTIKATFTCSPSTSLSCVSLPSSRPPR